MASPGDSSALAAQGCRGGGRGRGGGRSGSSGGRGFNRGQPSSFSNASNNMGSNTGHVRTCHYCGLPGHIQRFCYKLHGRPSQQATTNVASTGESSACGKLVRMTEEELARYNQFQISQQVSQDSSTATFAQTGNATVCLSSASRPWVIDSGATDHMTGVSGIFSEFHESSSNVTLADGSVSTVKGVGTVPLTPSLSLSSVMYLPSFPFNLMSVSHLTKAYNCSVTFYPDSCVFQDLKTKKTIGRGHVSEGLYVFEDSTRMACSAVTPLQVHCRLGHPSLASLKKLDPQFHSLGSLECQSCQFGKLHRTSFFPRVNKQASQPFALVHSDVWGSCPVTSKLGFKYFVTFVDDYSRATWLYLMRNRSELFSNFCAFVNEVQTQFSLPVRVLRSDNAKEYFSKPFSDFMTHRGILHQSSCSDTPQQNGVAERKNRHLLEVARSLLFEMKIDKSLWADAVMTACYLINRMPSSVLKGATPHSFLFPSEPLFHLPPRIFGCVCYIRDHRPGLSKLDARSLKCIFVGYSRTQKGYRCYCPSLRKYFTTADVTFFESTVYSDVQMDSPTLDDELLTYVIVHSTTKSTPAPPPIHQVYSRRPRHVQPSSDALVPTASSSSKSEVSPPSTDLDVPIAHRKGTRSCTQHPITNFVSYSGLSASLRASLLTIETHSTPKSVAEALSSPGWKTAMEDELWALEKNQTWDLVPLPAGKNAIGCKWVFSVKVNPDGSVARLKARLVAKGYAQIYGVDYGDTFSPVAKMTSVRLLLSLAASSRWPLFQLDVKNAFLHGDLHEEVYMEQPPGFVAQGESGHVCRLKKSLYGLKQSPRAWFGRFTEVVLQFGLTRCHGDHSMFYRVSNAGRIFLVVYVDDIVITGDDFAGIDELKLYLKQQFETKDLGRLRYFLGIEVATAKRGIHISQRKYALDLLAETGMLGAKPLDTPMEAGIKLMAEEGELLSDPERYGRLVGKLNYLTITRPDISFPVSVVSQFMSSPRIPHWDAVVRILRYLKKAPGRGLLYRDHGHKKVEAFSDADWAGSPIDRRSTSGFCTFVGGNLVSWKSKKQNVVARSSTESEYRAMAQTTCELVWMRQLLVELGFKDPAPMELWCDNQAALHIASNPVFHERTKHIEVDYHFVREKLEAGVILTNHIKTGEQLADIFTKSLGGSGRIEYICNKLGMFDIHAPA